MKKKLPRIGVFVCECGINIAATVDVEEVTSFAAELPGVVIARLGATALRVETAAIAAAAVLLAG